jgi:hypothetical protein
MLNAIWRMLTRLYHESNVRGMGYCELKSYCSRHGLTYNIEGILRTNVVSQDPERCMTVRVWQGLIESVVHWG